MASKTPTLTPALRRVVGYHESIRKFDDIVTNKVRDSDRESHESGVVGLANFAAHTWPPTEPWDVLDDSWLGDALRHANKDGDVELVKLLLRHLLANIGIKPVAGVLTPRPKLGKPGRPKGGTAKRRQIYKLWVQMGEDPYSFSDLAKKVYGERFISDPHRPAQKRERKNQIQRCRIAIIRELEFELEGKRREHEKALRERAQLLEQARSSNHNNIPAGGFSTAVSGDAR